LLKLNILLFSFLNQICEYCSKLFNLSLISWLEWNLSIDDVVWNWITLFGVPINFIFFVCKNQNEIALINQVRCNGIELQVKIKGVYSKFEQMDSHKFSSRVFIVNLNRSILIVLRFEVWSLFFVWLSIFTSTMLF